MTINTNTDEQIFEILANKYSRAILSLTSMKECSAGQLSEELGIPLPTVYRRLRLMESSGLIRHVKTVINLFGNEEKYFRCAIRGAYVCLKNGVLTVDLKKGDSSDKIIRLWKRLAHPGDNEN